MVTADDCVLGGVGSPTKNLVKLLQMACDLYVSVNLSEIKKNGLLGRYMKVSLHYVTFFKVVSEWLLFYIPQFGIYRHI